MGRIKYEFSWKSFLNRLLFALVLVFATYNPDWPSYYRWAVEPLLDPRSWSLDIGVAGIAKLLVGVVLTIGWVIFLRATIRSLGAIGIALALAFFGTLVWLIVKAGGVDVVGPRPLTYIVLIMLSALLAVGMSWSHVRRRLTGQFDTDELEP